MRHLIWNLDPAIVRLGAFEVRWYGIFFALGFLLGFKIMIGMYRHEQRNIDHLSDLVVYLMVGTIVGARLGHVLLYQPDYFLWRPWEIFMIWHGGLASHGGFIGVMAALYLYLKKHRDMRFIELGDRLVIPCLLAAALIRVGNFFNSEILGTPSNLPWAIVFARVDDIPRHPAMLYEALAYLIIFFVLYRAYWKSRIVEFPGRLLGIAIASGFSARFLIEFVKENQEPFENFMPLNMGQLLSVPFILAGLFLIYNSHRTSPNNSSPNLASEKY